MHARTRHGTAAGIAALTLLVIAGFIIHRGTRSTATPETLAPIDHATSATPAIPAGEPSPSPQSAEHRLSRAEPPPSAAPLLDAAGLPVDPGVRRQTYVRVDIPLSLLAEPQPGKSPLRGFSVPVFDGQELDIEITSHEVHGTGSGSFVGQVAGKPGSFVILGYDGEAEAGTIQIPQEGYVLSITYAGDGLLRISELDPNAIPGCGEPLTPNPDPSAHAL